MIEALELQFQELREAIDEGHNILIVSHERPDPDAVASVLAFHNVLKKMGKNSQPFLADAPPKNLSFLPGFFEIKNVIDFEPDLLLGLDYGDFKRMRLPEAITQSPGLKIATVDHHLAGDQRGEIQILGPEFSSTAEIVYHWLKHQQIEIDKDLATCLLAGIFSDSGGFCHTTTSPQTLNIVSELLLKGVPLGKITYQTMAVAKPVNVSQAWGQILARTQLDQRTGLAHSWVSPEDIQKNGISFADFDGLTNLVANCSTSSVGLFLMEYEKGKIKGSLRSEPQGGINVAEIAKGLGGGGHEYSAGFQQEGTIEETLKKVISLIK